MEPLDIAGDLEPLEAKASAELAAKAKTHALLTAIVHEAGQVAGASAQIVGIAVTAATGNPLLGAGAAALMTAAGEATKGPGLTVPKATLTQIANEGSTAAAAAVTEKTGNAALGAAVSSALARAVDTTLAATGS